MKRRRILALAASLFAALLVVAAGSAEQAVAGTDVRILFPDGWYYADETVKDGDPACRYMNKSAEELRRQLQEQGILCIASSGTNGLTMYMTTGDALIADFEGASEVTLNAMAGFFGKNLAGQGYEIQRTATWNGGTLPMNVIRYNDAAGYMYCDFITAKEGVLYTFRFAAAQMDGNAESLMESIMATVRFGGEAAGTGGGGTVEVSGEWAVYGIGGMDLTIAIPQDGFSAFWRGMGADAPSLSAMGQTLETWEKTFSESTNLMLMAVTPGTEQVISLFINETPDVPDLLPRSDGEIQRYVRSVDSAQNAESGSTTVRSRILRTNRYAFVMSELQNSDDTYPYSLTGHTFHNGQMILMRYDSATPLGDSEAETLRKMLVSVKYNGAEQKETGITDWLRPAEVSAYEVKVDNFTVKIPPQFVSFTAETQRDDLCINTMGLTYDLMANLMQTDGDSLLAFDYSLEQLLTISVMDLPGESDYTGDYLGGINMTMALLAEAYSADNDGITVIENRIVSPLMTNLPSGQGYYWILVNLFYDTDGQYHVTLFTVKNEKQYIIMLQKADVTDAEIRMMAEVAQSVVFVK